MNMKRGVVLLVIGFMSGVGCTSMTKTTVSLQNLNCQSCGASVVQKLSNEEGIGQVQFVRKVAEVSVEHIGGDWDGASLAKTIQGYGYGAEAGSGKGSYIPFPDYPEGSDVVWLSKAGEVYEESAGIVPGKVTVIDFYAPWCGPCREVDRFLIYQLTQGAEFAVRKVNVQDWDSEVAAQLGERLTSLPYVEVYNANGELVESITGLDLESLKKVLKTEEK